MHKLQIDPIVYILAAFLLLTVPVRWLVATVCAAAFHELCHWLVISFLGGNVWQLRIGVRGAQMETEPMDAVRDMIAAAAGPVGSLLLLSLAGYFPRIALCAAIQGAYNLLPMMPLDGGRIINGILCCLFSPVKAKKISQWLTAITATAILLAALSARLGLLPILIMVPFLREWREIFLAKRAN